MRRRDSQQGARQTAGDQHRAHTHRELLVEDREKRSCQLFSFGPAAVSEHHLLSFRQARKDERARDFQLRRENSRARRSRAEEEAKPKQRRRTGETAQTPRRAAHTQATLTHSRAGGEQATRSKSGRRSKSTVRQTERSSLTSTRVT